MAAVPEVNLERFTTTNNQYYSAYRRLKYEIFVVEQKWRSLADGTGDLIAREDPLDEHGRFWLATEKDGRPIGIVRGLRLIDGFPHRELFGTHRGCIEEGPLSPYLCTVNALGVVPSYRQVSCRVTGCSWNGTVASLLTLAVLSELENEGMRAAVATAGGLASTHLFRMLGFLVIDRPTRTWLHPDLIMANVGLVFGSSAHANARHKHDMCVSRIRWNDHSLDLQRYFERCESGALGARSLASFFHDAEADESRSQATRSDPEDRSID